MTALQLAIRHKSFARADGELNAIENIEIEIAENEFVAVLGPSGCGKTTMLQIAAGLDNDYAGSARYADGLKDRMAYVFQSPTLLPWRTVRQNIELVFSNPQAHADDIASVLEAVGLAGSEDIYPLQLSMGMQRRASLARAFVLRPQLLLMDEPFVSLDEPLAARLRDLLQTMLAGNPASVLFVTHDWREALSLADRLIFLSPGPARITGELAVSLSRRQRSNPAELQSFRDANEHLFQSG
ncbi:ATP-binding cassette domain-containing protein [Anderseniella sp. Alg231-50]|uniref:ATP-binding cassette domain-containing protein n=1 Tax=Anderseniella sp. Alg231-50 TaxID=1922226 RepID=UPI000D55291F